MPVNIGVPKPAGPADPLGWMTECHRRVENFTLVLVKAGRLRGGPLTSDERGALESALQYFKESAPKHTEDEERSLFPRLRAKGPEVRESLGAIMEALEREHLLLDSLHAELERLGGEWLAAGELSNQKASEFLRLAEEVSTIYEAHIAAEERQVFPVASDLLPAGELDAMAAEMAARRGWPIETVTRVIGAVKDQD